MTANKQDKTFKMPIYPDVTFQCDNCNNQWQLNYQEIDDLIKTSNTRCKIPHCACELTINDQGLTTLKDNFARADKLSKFIILFAIPYFMLSSAAGFFTTFTLTALMLIAGFVIIIIAKRILTQKSTALIQLNAANSTTTKTTNTPNNKKTKRKKNKNSN